MRIIDININEQSKALYRKDGGGLVRKASLNISTCYYIGMDERTPKEILDLVVAVREGDSFYASNDEFVRRCVSARGEEFINYAPFILPHELYILPKIDELEKRSHGCILIAGKEFLCGYD